MKRQLESLHSGSEEETAKEVARELTAEDQQAAKGQLIYEKSIENRQEKSLGICFRHS